MNAAQWIQLLSIVLGTIGTSAGVGGLLLMRQRKQKLTADTENVVVDTTGKLVLVQQSVIDSLTAENARLKVKCEGIEEEVEELREVIKLIGDRKHRIALPPEGIE